MLEAPMTPGLWPLIFIPEHKDLKQLPTRVDDGAEVEGGTVSGCDALDSLPSETRHAIISLAIEQLWNWSGRLFSTRQVEVRPYRYRSAVRASTFWQSDFSGRPLYGWQSALPGNIPLFCGICAPNPCSCVGGKTKALRLPGPVAAVEQVFLHGRLLDASEYDLVGDTIFLVNGEFWPHHNQPYGPLEEDGGEGEDDTQDKAWGITFLRGIEVPSGGQVAAGVLACELAKALTKDSSCQLPSRVQSITRQGVSMAILDEFGSLDDGRTGIWEIDSWLAAVTVERKSPSQVWSPDMPTTGGHLSSLGFGRRLG